MARKKNYQVPYYIDDGSIPHYCDTGFTGYGKPCIEWRDPAPVTGTLVINDTARGRSAAYFTAAMKETGAKFCVFITDLLDMIRDERFAKGEITATFEPCKRGMNFGLRLAK